MGYILLTAVSLALDAFAVSTSAGLTVKGFRLRDAVKMGVWFGLFQFLMPLLGWLLASTVAGYVVRYSPWIAFGLLAFVGGRMVVSALKKDGEPSVTELGTKTLFMLAVATSIDALAVGVTFAFMDINVWLAFSVIGAVAFILSVAGGMAGGKLGERFQGRAELIGGLVLIGIGAKILIESFIK